MKSMKELNASRQLKTTLYKREFEAQPKDLSVALQADAWAHRLGPTYHVGSTMYLRKHGDAKRYRPCHLMNGDEVIASALTWAALRDHIIELVNNGG